jgi:hypothetical protein
MDKLELEEIFVPLGWHTTDEFEALLLPHITKKSLEYEQDGVTDWDKNTSFTLIAYWCGNYTFRSDCRPYTTKYPDKVYNCWDVDGLYIDNDYDEDGTSPDFVVLWKENI